MKINQNILYLTSPGTVVSRRRLALYIKDEENNTMTIPVHTLKSICVFGQIRITPSVLYLCLKNQVSVHFHTRNSFFLGQVIGHNDTRYLVRKSQYAKSDDPQAARDLAILFVLGKLQNSRINLLRARRESESEEIKYKLTKGIDALASLIHLLKKEIETVLEVSSVRESLDPVRGLEGRAALIYFGCFTLMLKRQVNDFAFHTRTRRPPRDYINCLLSFLYALLRNECLTALSVAGIDPYVGWLHATRANKPAGALDLMEEFRPIADRLAITLINREQIKPNHFKVTDGGAVELTDPGRKTIIKGWQKRKQSMIKHELFKEKIYIDHLFIVQARLLSRFLRGEIPHYVPFLL
ncbi:MAG: CRISPR-associated endonuclease Cas1 [Proteobacteria bacterium]|nr:CRISPR-associated endonuclease Cas1 [Pseudomonadota bacterium]